VTIPVGVTSIESHAFRGCSGLGRVVFPPGVIRIEDYAFYQCTGLAAAVFFGNAPTWLGQSVFGGTAPGFTCYYLGGRTGFSSPTWRGYPATMINQTIYPAGTWLESHGYGYDTSLDQDPDGDGVDLRMAYALNLDPNRNLQGSLPAPVSNGTTLTLTFHAARPEMTYRVEISSDLLSWTSIDVTPSVPGPDPAVTVAISIAGPRRFLRLVVED